MGCVCSISFSSMTVTAEGFDDASIARDPIDRQGLGVADLPVHLLLDRGGLSRRHLDLVFGYDVRAQNEGHGIGARGTEEKPNLPSASVMSVRASSFTRR
jgi:hypothetical protein